jgi:hypothetical protein
LIEYRAEHPTVDEVPLKEIKSHNLTWLARRAGCVVTEQQEFYLKVLEKCALWAGRYPLPAKEDHMYEKRKALPSSEALLQRSRELHEKLLRGEIPRVFIESDVLHGCMGREELDVCAGLRDKLLSRACALIKSCKGGQQGDAADGLTAAADL